MSELTEPLRRLGFAEYEAKAYVALLQRSPLTGYELAKISGVPRADIYAVLQKLADRGAILRLDVEAGTRYAPVPADEVIGRLQARFEETATAVRRSLDGLSKMPQHEYVWNARGYSVLLEHAQALVHASVSSLLVAVSPPEAKALAESIAAAEGRGASITTLCLAACPAECGGCRGRIERDQIGARTAARWLVVVSDQRELLAGTIGGEEETMAVRTRQPLLVSVAARYILHSITLARVAGEAGEALKQLVRAETWDLLASLEIGALQQTAHEFPGNRKQAA